MTKIQTMHKDIKWKANLQTHFKSHFQSYFLKNNFSTKSITITFHKAAVLLTLQQSPWRPDTFLIVQGGLWRLKSSQRQNQALVLKCHIKARFLIHSEMQMWAKNCTGQSYNCVEKH